MLIDREWQRFFLLELSEVYPDRLSEIDVYARYCSWKSYDVKQMEDLFFKQQHFKFVKANLAYLNEHGLITSYQGRLSFPGGAIHICSLASAITAKGIDFLADDGGLSAILNTVTVKFDVENVRSLVEAGLLRANVPEEKQGALKKAIKEAPGTVLQTAVSKMVEKGMSDPVGTAKAVAGLFGISW